MAHHYKASGMFTSTVQAVEHRTGINIVSYPLKVEPLQKFTVEIAVLCMDKGCDLMGKQIFVSKNGIDKHFIGSLTWKAYNLRYLKWEYHGKVTCTAPDKTGTLTWWGIFPYQSRHLRSSSRFG